MLAIDRIHSDDKINDAILTWYRASSAKTFLDEIDNFKTMFAGKKGVYIWIENIKDRSYVNYIGKSQSCILSRNIEHLYHSYSLKYSIPAIYRKNKKRLIFNWLSKNGTKDSKCQNISVTKAITDIKFQAKTKKELMKYLENITIYFCPLEKLSDKEIQIIEANLIISLKPLENTGATKSSRFAQRKMSFSHNPIDCILNFDILKINNELYLNTNSDDPRSNANSLFRSK